MNKREAFFVQTIVGPPQSVVMGHRMSRQDLEQYTKRHGLTWDLETSRLRLSQSWVDWFVINYANVSVGQPFHRPSPLRQWLERNALRLALGALAVLLLNLSLLLAILLRNVV